jgi:phage gpG-like protein
VRGRVPHLSGQLAGSVTSSTDDEGAGVGYDGSVPYDAWIEFGGVRGRPHVPEGRYVYPTALDAQDEFAAIAADAAADSAGRFAWTH